MYLSSKGVLNSYNFNTHLIELSLFIEAILYSTILSKRYSLFKINLRKSNNQLLRKHKKYQILKIKYKDFKHKINNLLAKLKNRTANEDTTINLLKEAVIGINNTITIFYILEEFEDGEKINIAQYIDKLLNEHSKVYEKPKLNFILDVDSSIAISKKNVEACLYIISEAIINISKYAYPNKKEGDVSISFNKKGNKQTLIIQDFGVGFKNVQKNGLLFIENFVKLTLKGRFKIEADNGVKLIVSWSE